MAVTAHGFNIPSPTVVPTTVDKEHFKNCIECRQEIGAAVTASDRRGKPWRTEEDVVDKLEKEERIPPTRNETPRNPKVRTHIWEEKTWPVEAVQITQENVHAIAALCGGEVVEGDSSEENVMQYELRLPSFRGMLAGPTGHYAFKYRHTGRWDIMKPDAFESKYHQTGLRGRDL